MWQPIETAPRDGGWFAICVAGEGLSYEVGCYEPYHGRQFIELESGLFRAEEYLLGEWRGFNNMHRATHWMPLPPPPERLQEEG